MKIGIITFHNADNYGAVLQSYALSKYIKSISGNFDVSIINHHNKKIEECYKVTLYPRTGFNFIKKIFLFPKQMLSLLYSHRFHAKFDNFRKNKLEISDNKMSDYDVIIYGSDQIWRGDIIDNDLTYFGSGFKGKKISYAASDGGLIKLDNQICELIKDYQFISCREENLTKKINSCLSVNAVTVCDPVFLLERKDWLLVAKLPKLKDYILVYTVEQFNQNLIPEAIKLGKKLNKKVVVITLYKSFKLNFSGVIRVYPVSPEEFVGYIAKADYVITTSFHGTALSILLNKVFYVLKFTKTSERIVSLLNNTGLSEQFVEKIPDDINNNIYSSEKNRKLQKYIDFSCKFLFDSLKI